MYYLFRSKSFRFRFIFFRNNLLINKIDNYYIFFINIILYNLTEIDITFIKFNF